MGTSVSKRRTKRTSEQKLSKMLCTANAGLREGAGRDFMAFWIQKMLTRYTMVKRTTEDWLEKGILELMVPSGR
jgi:hypothetical protein